MSAPKLKPCPFCGGEAFKEKTVTDGSVWCSGCGAQITKSHGRYVLPGEVRAVKAWNRRTP